VIRRADYTTPLHLEKFALTSLTCGGCLVGIVRSQTKVTDVVVVVVAVLRSFIADNSLSSSKGNQE
jgi:hypothetical protein